MAGSTLWFISRDPEQVHMKWEINLLYILETYFHFLSLLPTIMLAFKNKLFHIKPIHNEPNWVKNFPKKSFKLFQIGLLAWTLIPLRGPTNLTASFSTSPDNGFSRVGLKGLDLFFLLPPSSPEDQHHQAKEQTWSCLTEVLTKQIAMF